MYKIMLNSQFYLLGLQDKTADWQGCTIAEHDDGLVLRLRLR